MTVAIIAVAVAWVAVVGAVRRSRLNIEEQVTRIARHYNLPPNSFAFYLCIELLTAALAERKPSLLRDGVRMALGSTKDGCVGRSLTACDALASEIHRIYDQTEER